MANAVLVSLFWALRQVCLLHPLAHGSNVTAIAVVVVGAVILFSTGPPRHPNAGFETHYINL
jgi:hypothetical protein